MTDKGQTSSMTSVTEEDSSPDSESDTTESSYSNITSSVLSSTDTDDKLTPGLCSISISSDRKNGMQLSTEKRQVLSDETSRCRHTAGIAIPSIGETRHAKRKRQKNLHSSLLKSNFNKTQVNPSLQISSNNAAGCKENLGLDDTNDNLSTDFSDTSSRKGGGDKSNNNEFDEESDDKSNSNTETVNDRPFLPNMNSSLWYQASCFDRYWNHYNFVMEWYQKHVQAVETLQRQANFPWSSSQFGRFWNQAPQSPIRQSKRNRRSKRARSRRKMKAWQRSGTGDSASFSISATDTDTSLSGQGLENPCDGEEEDDLEMEITEDMMEFFTTSLKHKMERDNEKKGSDGKQDEKRCNIEQAEAGHQGASTDAPSERPGVRRAAEMKELYGAGAPMVHGMETALQMTYDRISDKFQPKLWPNMPLKIVFS